MSQVHAPPGLVLVCLNVHGLTPHKLLHLLAWLRDRHVDAAILTETQTNADPADMLRQQPGAGVIWPRAQLFHSPGNGHTGGVTIILGPSCHLSQPSVVSLAEGSGRVLRVDLSVLGSMTSLVGVYAPAQPGERPAFFANVLRSALPTDGRPLIIGGDFNCVLSSLDVVAPPGEAMSASGPRFSGAAALAEVMEDWQLHDVWREQAGAARNLTHLGHNARSGARLDRWLVSTPTMDLFPDPVSDIGAATAIRTDHLPVFLRLQATAAAVPCGKGLKGFPLLVLNMPEANADLLSFLAEECRQLEEEADENIVALWDNLKERLHDKAWELFLRHRRLRLKPARAADRAASKALQRLVRNRSPAAHDSLLQAVHEASRAATAAWARMAAKPIAAGEVLDHMFGDGSSYYFHHQVKAPPPPVIVRTLNRPGRQPDEDPGTVDLSTMEGVGTALEYAASFYSSDSPIGLFRDRPDIAADAQETLLQTVSPRLSPDAAVLAEGLDGNGILSTEELELALQMATRGSSPGYDGLPYEVYRAFAPTLVPVLRRVFNAAFLMHDTDAPLADLLGGVICLVPKPGQPRNELAGYRPITLLNCDAKLIMLVIANRLQRPLDYVIDITQSAFLRGRDISDNVRYQLGLARRLHELGLPGWLLHTDLTKAYDTVDRGWLSRAMTTMGLRHDGVVRWCRILMGGSSARVRLNGFLTAPFPVRNGLPQGSALSCTEWVIALQPLVSYLNHLQSIGRISPLSLPSGAPAPAAPAFADDMTARVLSPTADGLAYREAFELGHRAGLPALSVSKTRLVLLNGPAPEDMNHEAHLHHPPTGFRLQDPKVPHRLLGVPIAASPEACRTAAYAHMPGAIRAAAARWEPMRANALGRAHVAVQCLASKAVYQLQFQHPGDLLLPGIRRAINPFVARSGRAEEESPLPHHLYPGFAVCALPVDKGGLGMPDVEAHATAMLAKAGWLLFRYSSHPWHELLRHEVASAFPASIGRPEGCYQLVTDPECLQPAALGTYAQEMVTAFTQLPWGRVLKPEEQPFHSIMLELTFSNRHLPVGTPPVETTEVHELAHAWHRLSDVRAAYLRRHSLQPPAATALDLILSRLPAAWRDAVTAAHPPPPAWRVLTAPHVRPAILQGPDPMRDHIRLWELWPSGVLHPLPDAHPLPAPAAARPALVVSKLKPKSAWLRSDYDFFKEQQQLPQQERREVEEPWLIGVYDEMELDPTVWGIRLDAGTHVSLLQLQVCHARRSCAHDLACKRGVAGVAKHGAAWPALWASTVHFGPAPPDDAILRRLGLEGLEEAWRRSWLAAQQEGPPMEQRPTPAWVVDPSHRVYRPSPADRAAAREAPEPPFDPPSSEYTSVWTRLRDPTIFRPFRVTCWKLLHGTLGCRAFLAHVRRNALQGTDQVSAATLCCRAPSCIANGTVETLTHAFLTCPEVTPVIDWMLATWEQLGQPPAPRTWQVLLADDLSAWEQGPTTPGAVRLWTRLRVTTLGAIWRVRCLRESTLDPTPFARQVVLMVVDALVKAILRDWRRTQGDVRRMDDGAFCMDWWRGMDCTITVDKFIAQWANPPVFCRVVGEAPEHEGDVDTRSLELLIGDDTPVVAPFPPLPPLPPLPPSLA